MAQSQTLPQPVVLTVPGLGNSGSGHWQTHWERHSEDMQRVDLGMWDDPHRNTWVNKLNLAIHRAGRPVVLVAHSLGCLVTAWWARLEQPAFGDPVIGALLVAPPEVDFFPIDERLERFAPTPSDPLPFPSLLVASRSDPYMGFHAAHRLARAWGSELVDAGEAGHINAQSGLGDWGFGRRLLDRLIAGEVCPRGTGTSRAAIPAEAPSLAHGLVLRPQETTASG